jgi:hypothetical protein
VVLPPSQDRFQKPADLIFFICLRSLPSEKTVLPVNSMDCTLVLGPSSMMKETCWPAPPTILASTFTVAASWPFSASISLMMASTRRALAGSKKVSILRVASLFLSSSSMLVVVIDLLPRKSTIWTRLRSQTRKTTIFPFVPSVTLTTRSSRKPVSHNRRKSSFSLRSS